MSGKLNGLRLLDGGGGLLVRLGLGFGSVSGDCDINQSLRISN